MSAVHEMGLHEMGLRAHEADVVQKRLEGLGYQVHVAQHRHSVEAWAIYDGRTVGYGSGRDTLEALRSLAGDLGVEV